MIAYVEGPLCFYHAALVWAWLGGADGPRPDRSGTRIVLIGLLAGAAMGCKYTALISAVIPLRPARRRRLAGGIASLRPLLAFGLGWGLIMGPWLVKNVIDTGDPVYPLGYRVFHGRDWDDAMEAKWRNRPRARRHLLARARRLDRGRGGPVGLAIAALRRAGAAGPASARLASARDERSGDMPGTSS